MSRHHKATPAREWEGIRQKAFAEQGRRCGKCGKAGALEVHHVKELASTAGRIIRIICRYFAGTATSPPTGQSGARKAVGVAGAFSRNPRAW